MSKVIMDSGKSLVVVVFDSLAVKKNYEERLQNPAAFVRKLGWAVNPIFGQERSS